MIETRTEGHALFITINRPDVMNALDADAHARLAAVFDEYAANADLRVAVITGAGERSFCAGSDLKAREKAGGDRMPATGFAGLTERFDLYKPVIAAINGHAIGGGLEIVLACDLAIAARQARFGLPEVHVGLAASGGLHRLARQLPMKQAMEVALTGRIFDAEEACRLGLINQVVEAGELVGAIGDLIAALEKGAPLALQASKQMMSDGLSVASLQDAFQNRYPAFERMLESDDAREGSRAFIEKRRPVWRGN